MALVLYHGTSQAALEGIQREGLRPPHYWPKDMLYPQLTTNFEEARWWAQQNWENGPVILEYRIPLDSAEEFVVRRLDVSADDPGFNDYMVKKPVPWRFVRRVLKQYIEPESGLVVFRRRPDVRVRGSQRRRPARRPSVRVRQHRRRL